MLNPLKRMKKSLLKSQLPLKRLKKKSNQLWRLKSQLNLKSKRTLEMLHSLKLKLNKKSLVKSQLPLKRLKKKRNQQLSLK